MSRQDVARKDACLKISNSFEQRESEYGRFILFLDQVDPLKRKRTRCKLESVGC